MTRSFEGRVSEESYNPELYKIFEILRNMLDLPLDPSIGPITNREGALWLDRQNGGDMKYYSEGLWKLLFQDRFRMTGEILSPTQPDRPVTGQLWLNDGILMYYSGAEWLPVKSVNVDAEFNLSAFEQFLLISPIEASGNVVVGAGQEQKSQFLLPSVDMDKFFINGQFTSNYERVSNVALQYPTAGMQGKVASAVHMNPSKLASITKKLIRFDKMNPIIPVSEVNTEYYGFRGAVGHLLLKTNTSSSEYTSVSEGILLSPLAAVAYEFVLAITYKFQEARQEGVLHKSKIRLNGSNSVHIGTIIDPLCVFVQGMYLDENSANYTYDSVNGFLNLPLETKMDVGVLALPSKEIGTITELNASGNGVVTVNGKYNRPIVFVSGVNVDKALADYTTGTGTNANKIYIKNAKVGMRYAIAEIEGVDEGTKLFVKTGTTNASGSIPCSFSEVSGDTDVILFVDGILVSQKDITRNPVDGSITVYGMVAGMSYLLLKDPGGRLVFNDTVSFTTVPTPSMDDALVYVDNYMICDSSTVYTTKLPATGVPGETKLLTSNGIEQWYIYTKGSGWNPVPSADTELIEALNGTALGYTTSRKSISILQNFGDVEATYFAYSYANGIEEPLLRGNIITNDEEDTYRIAFNHTYPMNANALSVWMNGIRQYPNMSVDPANPDGIVELESSKIKLLSPIVSNLFYVIERPEKAETKSCQREILGINNRVSGASNVYQTNLPLYPGNLRVFISGYRQPSTAYKIIDPYTLMLIDPVVGSMDNYPVETIEVDGEIKEITHTMYDQILIETRQDYNLREVTLPVRYAGQKEWTASLTNLLDPRQGGDGLPKSILDSKDFVMIYINGAAYGKEYVIDKDRESIILLNEDVTSALGVDYLQQYFLENPEAYIEWKSQNGYAEYQPKPHNDRITFEWR